MAGTWQGLVNQPTFQTSTMFLTTDGRVMVQEDVTRHWHTLTPDDSGSYVNGTWSTLADSDDWRLYYASGILRDGRLVVVGGEYSSAGGDTNRGEIYDPVSDKWSALPLPPWPIVGDAASCVLPDGRLMIGALLSGACLVYDPVTNSWSPAASKAIRSNEESWILLPDNTIVSPQCFSPFQSEKYIVSSNTWKNEGPVPVTLVDPVTHEIGPAMLMYNGKVIFFGAANSGGLGKTAIYSPPAFPTGTGAWVAGPDIPKVGNQTIVCSDCPASLLPNGKVLFTAARFQAGGWGSPVLFFEYDPASNTISQAPTPSNNGAVVYVSRLVLLPTGQVLFSPSSQDIQVYTPDGGPQEAWRPTISAIVPHCSGSSPDYYLLKGTQLNGLSQANTYGDDCAAATNYPLVRLRNTHTGKVYFCRTYQFSTMGVATGPALESTRFDASLVPYGDYDLCVIANGISSHCVPFCHRRPRACGCGCGCKKQEPAGCCRPACCDDPCCEEDEMIDPEVARLKLQVRGLQNMANRLAALAPQVAPQRPEKEITKEEADDAGKKP